MDKVIKHCSNCKFLPNDLTDGPCFDCKYQSKWEPKENKFKAGDVVVKKSNADIKIYIYLRNGWVLHVPNYVLVRSECSYRFSAFIDKLISDSKASWIDKDNLEFASPEDISVHDNRAKEFYHEETLNKWFSGLIGETEKKDLKTLIKESFSSDASLSIVSDMPNMIKDVIFRDPATIIFWKDGTKTVVKTQDGEKYDKEKGFAMAVCKKVFGNERDYYHVFKHWMRKGKVAPKMEVRNEQR